ncbi:MAG: family 16 glycosylhydrolase [Chitinophagales bacterium]
MKNMFLIALIICTSCNDKNTETPAPALPSLSINSVTLFEGDGASNFPFKVNLSKPTDKEVTVNFTTKDNTALAGNDYEMQSGTLTIPANSNEVAINVTVIGDTVKQTDKQFEVVLSNPVNATLATNEGTGTIRNDDTYIYVPLDGYITPESYAGYNTLWKDEFNGTSIDNTIWGYDIGNSGWGNNESQYYTNSSGNSYVSNGNLVIVAKKENYGGSEYTSARLLTKNKKDFTFGRVDIRAVLPKGQGIWPALWMLGSKIDQTGWPNCGEIDIMEVIGSIPNVVNGTIHYGPQGATQSTSLTATQALTSGDFSDKYHVFSLIWSQGSIQILVDDISYFQVTQAQVGAIYPFNEPFFVIFNVAVGGNWPGYPDATTVFPQQMLVDYIRVFEKL